MAVAGVAARKRDGETVSGDAGTYFKRADGTLYVLLCDGMGSGAQANRESTLAIRLLRQFLQAGVDTEQALVILSSALALRGEEAGGFTTIDLLQVDLFTGTGRCSSWGPPPPISARGRRCGGSPAPPSPRACPPESGPPRTAFPFTCPPATVCSWSATGCPGRGTTAGSGSGWPNSPGTAPRSWPAQLITHSPQGATDDRTALVVRIERREEGLGR